MGKNWLVISYFANIDAMAPAHHIDDRLPSFRKEGIEVRLLSSPCGVRCKNVVHTRILSPAPSGIRYEVRYFLRRKTRRKFWFKFWETLLLLPVYPFYFLEKIFLRLDSTWSWFITASAAAVVMALRYRPATIYSTGGPVSAHMAAMFAAAITGRHYVAEFQDPLFHQYSAPGKFERRFIRRIERLIFSRADAVVFLTEKAAENARERYHSGKSFAIYAGAIPQENPRPYTRGGHLTVAHFGSLGGSRHLDHILSALTVLISDDPALSGYFRLALYGNIAKTVKRSIELFPYRDTILSYGKVAREQALESMQGADVLLLIQNTDDVSFETIPSKVYEYLHTGRPILALVYRNAELQAMLERMGHIVVQADDAAAIQEGLMTYIGRWKENLLRSSDAKSPYTVGRAVSRLIEVASGSLPGEKK
jgi:glycosyltransferase involved in cell wall biosynthesis